MKYKDIILLPKRKKNPLLYVICEKPDEQVIIVQNIYKNISDYNYKFKYEEIKKSEYKEAVKDFSEIKNWLINNIEILTKNISLNNQNKKRINQYNVFCDENIEKIIEKIKIENKNLKTKIEKETDSLVIETKKRQINTNIKAIKRLKNKDSKFKKEKNYQIDESINEDDKKLELYKFYLKLLNKKNPM